MLYDDDTSPHPFFEIRSDDLPPPEEPTSLPTAEVQARIVGLGQQNGWGPHRINASLRRRDRVDVPVETIRWVLANA